MKFWKRLYIARVLCYPACSRPLYVAARQLYHLDWNRSLPDRLNWRHSSTPFKRDHCHCATALLCERKLRESAIIIRSIRSRLSLTWLHTVLYKRCRWKTGRLVLVRLGEKAKEMIWSKAWWFSNDVFFPGLCCGDGDCVPFFNLPSTFSTVFHVPWMKNGNIGEWKVKFLPADCIFLFCLEFLAVLWILKSSHPYHCWFFSHRRQSLVVNYYTVTSPIYCCRCFAVFVLKIGKVDDFCECRCCPSEQSKILWLLCTQSLCLLFN